MCWPGLEIEEVTCFESKLSGLEFNWNLNDDIIFDLDHEPNSNNFVKIGNRLT